MKKTVRLFLSITAAVFLAAPAGFSQTTVEGKVTVDKSVHDFGDIYIDDGPVSCTYTFKNVSNKPVLLLSAVTSCGCTEADWTREPIQPGKTGTVSATYNNADGPYPFDKTVTVYISDVKKPVVLHLRGSAHESAKPITDTYPVRIGNLGLKDLKFKAGNLVQGNKKSGSLTVANVGTSPLNVTFQDVDKNLKVEIYPNPIPAKSTAEITWTISASRYRYGKNWYYFTPVLDGKVYKSVGKLPVEEKPAGEEHYYSEPNEKLQIGGSAVAFWAVTKANFLGWPEELKEEQGSNPVFTKSTLSYGKVKSGEKVTLTFNYTNKGKGECKMHKLDADCHNVTVLEMNDTPAGNKGTIAVELDTKGMPKGENIIALELFTNSPYRPVISLQLTGTIQ